MLQGKHILVGISGGIAAYKIPELIRLLRKAGAEVRVATTKNALEFVTELTLQTLSGYKVYSDVFAAINTHSTEHISLPDWADLMIIAPATANVLGKMANGIADDALTTTFCAMRKPVVIAPAMNDKMYRCPATQEAMRHLSGWDNITMLDCAEGELACGTSGRGRMQEPAALLEAVYYALTEKDLSGKRVLITAGPTQEKIDPVRYISNYSTGKMGYALAQECLRRGAEVVLVSGPAQCTLPEIELFGVSPALRITSVGSAQEMYDACTGAFSACDIAILCAAVADFAPETVATQKIKKQSGQDTLTLTLRKTHDIAATLGQQKRPLVHFTMPKIRSMLSFPNPQRAVSDVSSSRCLPEGSSDARPYYSKCFRVLRENPFSSVGNGLLPEQPIKVHVSASIYYLLFSLLFWSAKSA